MAAEPALTIHTAELPEKLRPTFAQMRYLRVLQTQAEGLGVDLEGLWFDGEDLDDPTDPYVTGVYRADRKGDYQVQGWNTIRDMIDALLRSLREARADQALVAQSRSSAPRFRLDPETGQMVKVAEASAEAEAEEEDTSTAS